MKWFDRWFLRKCKWAWDHRDSADIEDVKSTKASMLIGVESEPDWGDGLRITIKKVIGGFVVSFRQYDRRQDRNEERHYIITDEQDFERELGKTISLESMRIPR
jgi:hypothetical protein